MVAAVGLHSPEMDWQRSITEYLQLGIIPNDEVWTWCLTHRAKGYLIHDRELYQRNTSGILQRCIPLKEGRALLLDILEGIYGHHTCSRSMVRNASLPRPVTWHK
jgi:hypothetical protein